MTDRTFHPAVVSDIREGDTVRITKDDAVIIAPVRHEKHYGLYVDVPGMDIHADSIELDEIAKAEGVTLERAEPQLPTDPGFYRTRAWADAAPALGFHLSTQGEWRTIWGNGSAVLRNPHPSDLPLVRLVKENAS